MAEKAPSTMESAEDIAKKGKVLLKRHSRATTHLALYIDPILDPRVVLAPQKKGLYQLFRSYFGRRMTMRWSKTRCQTAPSTPSTGLHCSKRCLLKRCCAFRSSLP